MRNKLALISAVALFSSALAATSVSARNLSISHGNLFRINWAPISFKNGSSTIAACDVSLEGSFHYSTIAKTPEALVGYITKASISHCTTGAATVLTEGLPWHFRYLGFQGTLPNILGLRDAIIGLRARIRENVFGIECLLTADATHPATGVARLEAGLGNRNVTGLTADSNARIPCSIVEGSFDGTGTVVEPATGSRLLIRLI